MTAWLQGSALWVVPPLLLMADVGLCLWRRSSAWPYRAGAALVAGIAGVQTWMTAASIRAAGSWDPLLHGIKVGLLTVVVALAVVTAVVLLSAVQAGAGGDRRSRSGRVAAGLGLVTLTAALYVLTLPWLATTGE